MPDWKKVAAAAILADGQIDENEIAILRKELKESDGKIGDEGIKFLLELRNTAQKKLKAAKGELNPKFEDFFFKVVQENVLKDGKIDAKEAGWLRTTLFADGKIDDREMEFLKTINKKAKTKSAEFEKLYTECETKHKKAAAKK
jgi:uncharacterized membrane protein YebE (DUF533 family)